MLSALLLCSCFLLLPPSTRGFSSTFKVTPISHSHSSTACSTRFRTRLQQSQNDLDSTPEEWEVRRRLVEGLPAVGGFPTSNPSIEPEAPKSWEDEESEISNRELARALAEAKFMNKDAQKSALKKIIDQYFTEGYEELQKEGERVLVEGLESMTSASLARSEEAAAQLLASIDQKIASFKAEQKQKRDEWVYDPLAEPVPTKQEQATAEAVASLEALLAAPSAGEEVGGDTMLDQGTVTELKDGLVLKEVVRTRADSGKVVVVGAEGPLGHMVLERLTEGHQASGISLEQAKAKPISNTAKTTLQTAATLIITPDLNGNSGAGGGLLGGIFGGGANAGTGAHILEEDIEALIDACAGGNLKHVICVTSGANGGSGGAFSMGGGVPPARAAEQALTRRSKQAGIDYTILRTGRLCGEVSGKPSVELVPNGFLTGDTSRKIAEEAVFQALMQQPARNATASICSAPGSGPPTRAMWTDFFIKLSGPELLRIPLNSQGTNTNSKGKGPDHAAAALWLREWAQLWTKPGSGLTTPVEVEWGVVRAGGGGRDVDRVRILFKPTTNTFVSSKEERDYEKATAAGKPATKPGNRRPQREGGLEFLVEMIPYPRIRVVRTAMVEGTVVKEMSENAILSRFQKDIKVLLG